MQTDLVFSARERYKWTGRTRQYTLKTCFKPKVKPFLRKAGTMHNHTPHCQALRWVEGQGESEALAPIRLSTPAFGGNG